MHRALLVAAVLVTAAPLGIAQTSTWKSDPMHSEVDFTVKHMGISNVHGRFGKVDATIVYDDQDITKSTVRATINLTDIDTGVAQRDNDLKSDRFFAVARYPDADFISTSVQKSSSGLLVSGNLTVRGMTRPVVLNVDGPSGPVTGMDKKMHQGFSATTTINRGEFGIASAMPTAIVGDEVRLTIDLDVARQ